MLSHPEVTISGYGSGFVTQTREPERAKDKNKEHL